MKKMIENSFFFKSFISNANEQYTYVMIYHGKVIHACLLSLACLFIKFCSYVFLNATSGMDLVNIASYVFGRYYKHSLRNIIVFEFLVQYSTIPIISHSRITWCILLWLMMSTGDIWWFIYAWVGYICLAVFNLSFIRVPRGAVWQIV